MSVFVSMLMLDAMLPSESILVEVVVVVSVESVLTIVVVPILSGPVLMIPVPVPGPVAVINSGPLLMLSGTGAIFPSQVKVLVALEQVQRLSLVLATLLLSVYDCQYRQVTEVKVGAMEKSEAQSSPVLGGVSWGGQSTCAVTGTMTGTAAGAGTESGTSGIVTGTDAGTESGTSGIVTGTDAGTESGISGSVTGPFSVGLMMLSHSVVVPR